LSIETPFSQAAREEGLHAAFLFFLRPTLARGVLLPVTTLFGEQFAQFRLKMLAQKHDATPP
jgi:hypothetical protein